MQQSALETPSDNQLQCRGQAYNIEILRQLEYDMNIPSPNPDGEGVFIRQYNVRLFPDPLTVRQFANQALTQGSDIRSDAEELDYLNPDYPDWDNRVERMVERIKEKNPNDPNAIDRALSDYTSAAHFLNQLGAMLRNRLQFLVHLFDQVDFFRCEMRAFDSVPTQGNAFAPVVNEGGWCATLQCTGIGRPDEEIINATIMRVLHTAGMLHHAGTLDDAWIMRIRFLNGSLNAVDARGDLLLANNGSAASRSALQFALELNEANSTDMDALRSEFEEMAVATDYVASISSLS